MSSTELNLQSVLEHVVKLAQGSLVATAVAIVWSAEDRHNVLIMGPVITLHRTTAFHTCMYRQLQLVTDGLQLTQA